MPPAVADIREKIDHPIIDGDGHQVEVLPLVIDCAREIAGSAAAERLARHFQEDAAGVRQVPAARARTFWTFPTENTLDRVTSHLPELLYRRLDQIGIDFALVFPGAGHALLRVVDDEARQLGTAAMNTYYAQVYGSLRDRLEPVAVIPTFTPEEACAELDHAVGELGLRLVSMSGVIPRTTNRDGSPGLWIDTLGHESMYDYDPVWAKCQELGVVPAFHANGYGWGSRTSRSNYVYNHLGNFASAQEAICRSLIMSGVPKRFPKLRFNFLEGGIAWGAQLYADLVGHYEKRSREAIAKLDPALLDLDLVSELLTEFASPRIQAHRDDVERAFADAKHTHGGIDVDTTDDFAESGITGIDDFVELFTQKLFFGCEADDPMNALGFNRTMLPRGARLNAVFGSDIGHWDVPDIRGVLPEAWELVEDGHITEEDFKDFTFGNVHRMLTDTNPSFFENTVLAGEAIG